MWATEFLVSTCLAVMMSTIRAYYVFVVANPPTCFDNSVTAGFLAVEVHCHSNEAVEFREVYHTLILFIFSRAKVRIFCDMAKFFGNYFQRK